MLQNPKPNHHSIIAEMHESANVILAHWHYFNCSVDVENLDEKTRGKSPLRQLTPEQFETVKSLWKRIRLWKTGRPQCKSGKLFSPFTALTLTYSTLTST